VEESALSVSKMGEGFLGVAATWVFGGNDASKGVVVREARIRTICRCLGGEARTPEAVIGVGATAVFDLGIAETCKA
jgi:hypothetical protein